MNLRAALLLLRTEEQNLGEALRRVSERHPLDSEVHELTPLLAAWSDADRRQLTPFLEQYNSKPAPLTLPAPPRSASFPAAPPSGQGQPSDLQSLVLDLQNLVQLATQVQGLWIIVALAAQAHSDRNLDALAETACAHTERQLAWCRTQIKLLAPQLLSAPPQKSVNRDNEHKKP